MPETIRFQADTFSSVSSRINTVADQLAELSQRLPQSTGTSLVSLNAKLARARVQCSALGSRCRTLSKGVRSAGETLNQCELGFVKHHPGEDASSAETGSSDEKKWDWDAGGLGWGVLGALGDIGGVAAAIGKNTDPSNHIKGAAKAYKAISPWFEGKRTTGKISSLKDVFSGNVDWQKAFGLDAYKAKAPGAATWISTAICSGVDNYKQWSAGEISVDRAVVEAAAETLASVGLKAGMTYAVGAAATSVAIAAGFAGAPVIVVGAVSAVAVWGVDMLWKNTLGDGKGIAESVGEVVGDAWDAGKKAVTSVAKDVKATLSSAKNAIAKWWKPAWSR